MARRRENYKLTPTKPTEDFDFKTYVAVWYFKQGWSIPDVHLRIFDFLEDDDWGAINSKVLLLWRGIGKSTIVDLWMAYKLTKNPALKFLIVSADANLGKKSSQDVLAVLRKHPLSKGSILDRLSGGGDVRKTEFFVTGAPQARDPSCVGRGANTTITGYRCDYIIYDDIEVPKNSGTEAKRESLRSRVTESYNMLTPEYGYKLFIGTYHDPISIYDEQINNGATFLRVPIITNTTGEFPYITGTSQWPERFPDEVIAHKQMSCGSKSEFLSQYLLIPSSTKDSLLDASLFKVYDGEVTFRTVGSRGYVDLLGKTLRSVSCFWDPALSHARLDDSVVAVVYTDSDNNHYIHRTIAVKGDTDAQCRQVRELAIAFNIPIVVIETNAIGATLPPMLIKHLAGTGIAVEGYHSPSTASKNTRIIQAYETKLYAGKLHISRQVYDGKFLGQIRDFDPSTTRNKDDYIDAVASAILRQPHYMAALPGVVEGVMKWMGLGSHKATKGKFKHS